LETRDFQLYGTDEAPAVAATLSAGALSVKLEGGNLRSIRFHDIEVLRGIYFLVRDTGWGTYEPQLTAMEVTQDLDRFSVRYYARCEGTEGVFVYRTEILGDANGNLRFTAEGDSPADFPANRIGFVVLHPIKGVAGADMEVEHTDGSRERVRMPEFVAPHQPALDIRALTHEAAPGMRVTVRMEGDAFEMEDQRNWTDASFKTYVRPLSKPRPFVLPAAKELLQSVTVSVEDVSSRQTSVGAEADAHCNVEIGEAVGVLPEIGLALDPADADEAISLLSTLRELAPQWLSIRVSDGADLTRAAEFSTKLGASVLAEIIIPGIRPDQEIERERKRLFAAAGIAPRAVVVCPIRDMRTRPTGPPPANETDIAEIIDAARRQFPEARIGGGMLTLFTELNRNPPPAEILDFVTHGSTAITHAADDASVMETLEAWPQVLRSTRHMYGSLPYWLCATIGMRENPYGAAPAANPNKRRVPMARFDPRHRSLFGAAWALGVYAAAANEGTTVVTLAHAAGDFGLAAQTPGGVRRSPIWRLLKSFARRAGKIRRKTLSDPSVGAIAFESGDGVELWIANLTARAVRAGVEGNNLEILDGLTASAVSAREKASGQFVTLGPYELLLCRVAQ
jgi:D-apionolactonase